MELAAKTMPKPRTGLLSFSTTLKNSTSDNPSSGANDGADSRIPVYGSSKGAIAKGETRNSSGVGHLAPGAETGNPKSTYADKAKTQEKPKEIVPHMLYVYATKLRKAPLAINDWKLIDDRLIDGLIDNPGTVNIAKSGFDATYRCGYIACRDIDSAKWCQRLVIRVTNEMGVGFRAWAKGEKPDGQLCRLFLPARFHKLSDQMVLDQLKKYNPTLQTGTILIKNSEPVQGGRAIYIEVDSDSYSLIKRRDHKLAFLAMDVDCQVAPPSPLRRAAQVGLGASIPGVTRLSTLPPNPGALAMEKAAPDLSTTAKALVDVNSSITTANLPTTSKDPSFKNTVQRDPRLEKIRHLQQQLSQLQQQPSNPTTSNAASDSIIVEHEGKRRRRNRGSRSKNRSKRNLSMPNPDDSDHDQFNE